MNVASSLYLRMSEDYMSPNVLQCLLIVLLIVQVATLSVGWDRVQYQLGLPPALCSRHGPHPLRARTPADCPFCRQAASSPAPAPTDAVLVPYAQLKSRCGRKKSINTAGFACPNLDCRYFNNTDSAVQALVGFGRHGRHYPIRDLYCQACKHKFSVRRHTPLYRLKTPPIIVGQVLHAIAEGLSPRAAARVFQLPEATVRIWLARAGQHSQALHSRILFALQLTHVQFDELRLRLRGTAEAAWLWVACDAHTKLIPAFALGPRTQTLAHQLIHALSKRLASGCLPVFSSDGLALYFYALTAHFGEWIQALDQRHRRWQVAPGLLYAQLIRRYRRRRLAAVEHRVCIGTPEAFRQALRAFGFSGRIQTAFIERLNLTVRRSVAALARRSWSTAQSLSELTFQFDWWRSYYHFARPHASLRQPLTDKRAQPGRPGRRRYRPRTPAQAARLTNQCWTVLELLAQPAPPLTAN